MIPDLDRGLRRIATRSQGGHQGPTNPTAQAAHSATQLGSCSPALPGTRVCSTGVVTAASATGAPGSEGGGGVDRFGGKMVPDQAQTTTVIRREFVWTDLVVVS